MKGLKIKGIGAYTPPLTVTNDELSKLVDTNDEWIRTRTGISERRITEGEDTSELAIKAVKKALNRSKLTGEEIDLIIVATVTPDSFTPSVSCLVQKEIGARNAIAFDINAACSGFVFALNIASTMMKSNTAIKNALVIGSEVLSKVVNWEDRSTCVLFGDGSGAVVLSRDEEEGKNFYFHIKSVGEKGDCLYIGAENVDNPFVASKIEKYKKISMKGGEVFKFSTSVICKSINKVIEESKLSIDDIDYIITHQANYRIIEYAAKKMKVPIDKFYINLDRYGNTSSASIPIALDEMFERGLLKEGMRIILAGFGGGLTYGSALIEL